MGIHRKISGSTTRAAATGSGSQSITGLGGKPIMVLFSAIDDGDSNTYSDGWDDGINLGCNFINNLNLLATLLTRATKSHTRSIQVQTNGGDGHSAIISSLDADGFTLSWTRIGNGRAITIKYLAIL